MLPNVAEWIHSRSRPEGRGIVTRAQNDSVLVDVEWAEGPGRPEPVSVHIERVDRKPLTADLIRKLWLGTLFVEMQAELAEFASRVATPSEIGTQPEWLEAERPQWEALALQFSAQRGRPRSPLLLQAVADAYREAYRMRKPVTEAVAKATNCSKSTAGKRIMAARDAGYLERKGEE